MHSKLAREVSKYHSAYRMAALHCRFWYLMEHLSAALALWHCCRATAEGFFVDLVVAMAFSRLMIVDSRSLLHFFEHCWPMTGWSDACSLRLWYCGLAPRLNSLLLHEHGSLSLPSHPVLSFYNYEKKKHERVCLFLNADVIVSRSHNSPHPICASGKQSCVA